MRYVGWAGVCRWSDYYPECTTKVGSHTYNVFGHCIPQGTPWATMKGYRQENLDSRGLRAPRQTGERGCSQNTRPAYVTLDQVHTADRDL